MQPVDSPQRRAPEFDSEARLALAREAFAAYQTRCFWSLSPDLEITTETLPIIIAGLRAHGDRAAFQLAARLCQ
jgi:hypothetical protein